MMRSSIAYRLLSLACCFAIGCASTYRKPRADLPIEERGVEELRVLLEDFEAAAKEGRYSTAEDMLQELRDGVKNADRYMIMHFDYPTLSGRVASAPKLLKTVERRAGIDDLIADGRTKLETAAKLQADIQASGPKSGNVEAFVETVRALGEIARQGKAYERDRRYQSFGEELTAALEAYGADADQRSWQADTQRKIAEALQDVAALQAANNPATPQRIELLADAIESYGECIEVATTLMKSLSYIEEMEIHSVIGVYPLAMLKVECDAERGSSVRELATLRWRQGIEAIAQVVTESLKNIEKQKTPLDILAANEKAVEVLGRCSERVSMAASAEGSHPDHKFKSHFGSKTAMALAEACAKVRENLYDLQPTLKWRAAVQQLKAQAKTAQVGIDAALKTKDKKARRDGLKAAAKVLKDCLNTSTLLAKRKKQWKAARPGKSEIKRVQGVWKSCSKGQKRAKKALTRCK